MTFSVVARCPDTGQLGVATQSHWFAVGTLVSWCRSGAGAVATQAVSEVAYGPRAMSLMADGASARSALDVLLRADAQREMRQILVVDADGGTAAHTGSMCIAHADHAERHGAAFGANVMVNAGTAEAMADVWEHTHGQTLARRMLQCLQAAQDHGGDLRGKQSAALRVHSPLDGEWWEGVNIDLRVDDNVEPLLELERLLSIREAYTEAEFAEAAEARGRSTEARQRYERAGEVLPYSAELAFWSGIALLKDSRPDEAQAKLRPIVDDPRWAELLRRVIASGQATCEPKWLSDLVD